MKCLQCEYWKGQMCIEVIARSYTQWLIVVNWFVYKATVNVTIYTVVKFYEI